MEITECSICREMVFRPGEHTCSTLWEIRCDQDDFNEAYEERGYTEDDAIERWAFEFDCGGGDPPTIANGMGDYPVRVKIRKAGTNDDWREFVVTGEWVPEYRVEEV